MATIGYLWKNRNTHPLGSKAFVKCWAKRFFSLPELCKQYLRRIALTNLGATIADTAEIGEVDVAGHRCNLKIGGFSILGKVHIALHDKVSIGDFVCINDGVQILTASHDVTNPEWQLVKQEITIGDYAWIAGNSIILPGVIIGKGAVVEGGSVVSRDVPDYAIVAGNPAVQVSEKRASTLIYNPCEFLATNIAWLKG